MTICPRGSERRSALGGRLRAKCSNRLQKLKPPDIKRWRHIRWEMAAMKRTLLFVPLVIMVAMLWRAGGGADAALAATCPSPAPSCSSSGLDVCASVGASPCSFACTIVGNRSDGTHASVAVITLNSGAVTAVNAAKNDSSGGATTFSAFSSQWTGTYCINSDNITGYLVPTSPTGICPIALVYNPSILEMRLLDSSENRGEVGVCEAE